MGFAQDKMCMKGDAMLPTFPSLNSHPAGVLRNDAGHVPGAT